MKPFIKLIVTNWKKKINYEKEIETLITSKGEEYQSNGFDETCKSIIQQVAASSSKWSMRKEIFIINIMGEFFHH